MRYLKSLHDGLNICFHYILINTEQIGKRLLANVTVTNEMNIYVPINKNGGVSITHRQMCLLFHSQYCGMYAREVDVTRLRKRRY
jgi:hypothetical protein